MRCRILWLALAWSGATWAHAEVTSPVQRGDLIAALRHAPALRAVWARAESARLRVSAAGRIADPEAEGMVSSVREPLGDTYPMWELTLRQNLPRAGERDADRERVRTVVSLAEAEYAVMAGELAVDVAKALAEADAARERTAVMEHQIERIASVQAALAARVSVGEGRSGDRLSLQSRADGMRLMIEENTRIEQDVFTDVRSRLGLAPDEPVPVYTAPAESEIEVEKMPAARLALAREQEARARVQIARVSARPMTAVGLRFERAEQPMGNMDTVGVAFMTEIPFRARGYARAESRAARMEEAAARTDAETARSYARAALARVERAERIAGRARALGDAMAARLEGEYAAVVRAAGVEPGRERDAFTVLSLIEILERETDARLSVIEAQAAAKAARAELWRQAPFTYFTP